MIYRFFEDLYLLNKSQVLKKLWKISTLNNSYLFNFVRILM